MGVVNTSLAPQSLVWSVHSKLNCAVAHVNVLPKSHIMLVATLGSYVVVAQVLLFCAHGVQKGLPFTCAAFSLPEP